jgi:hypothetical protein
MLVRPSRRRDFGEYGITEAVHGMPW